MKKILASYFLGLMGIGAFVASAVLTGSEPLAVTAISLFIIWLGIPFFIEDAIEGCSHGR